MFKIRHRAAFAAIACVCLIAGCDDAPPESKPGAPVASRKDAAPKLATLNKDMVAAVSSGKAPSAVSVHFALRAAPTVNMPLPVDVAIVPHRDFSSLSVHFDSQESLATTTGENFGPQSNVKSESTLPHQLVLLPTKEGMFMVTSAVDTEGAEGNVTRIFSIPVIVAPAAGAAPPAPPPPAAVGESEKH